MSIVNIVLIILLSITVVLYIITLIQEHKKINKIEKAKGEELKNIFKERWDKEEYELDNKLKQKESELRTKRLKLSTDFERDKYTFEQKLEQIQAVLKEKEKRYKEVNQDLDLYRSGKMEEIDTAAAEYEQHKRTAIEQSIDQYRNLQTTKANEVINDLLEAIKIEKEKLEIEKNKRAAINEEIRRQREIEEKEDFYRIQIDPNDLNDVKILRDVAPRLRHPEAVNKVIWSGYYQKPLAELRKRAGIEGSGIYKITRIKTGEIYIGQAVNISTRWSDHCKSALGVGTLASSQLHRVMAADGCENFTFEVIEEVPKDKLRERESYYIDFYDSKTYGLNTVKGDQNK